MIIREEIEKLTEKAIRSLQKKGIYPAFEIPEIRIERPDEESHGDYASGMAFSVGKIIKKDPMVVANDTCSEVLNFESDFLGKIEKAKPGFINFFISKEYLQKQVKEILEKKEKFGQLKIGKNQKAQVEFISANPTGPLHIGNGRGGFFGDTLSNVFKKAGFNVDREYYINNAKVNTQIQILGKTALGKGVTYLTEDLRLKIEKLKPKLKKITTEGEAGHLLAQEVQKDTKDFIEKKLKIRYDNWVSEESLYKKDKVKKIHNWLKKKNLVYQKEGAEWLKISQFGAPKDEVIVRQTGDPTYFLADIAYHKDKFDRNYVKIINIWGADHQGHVPKIKAVAKILGFKGDLDILISQMMRLKGGLKLSKRKGQIITLEELVDEVGLDACRFFYLTKSLNTQMEFDIDLAKERSSKSPVYYVQYAHARICSIFSKTIMKPKGKDLNLLNHESEFKLIKELLRFPEVIEDTAQDYQVQRLPQYAIDLATAFHQFYRDCKVITKEKDLAKARLSLILAAKIVLKNTLDLMGISAPEKM